MFGLITQSKVENWEIQEAYDDGYSCGVADEDLEQSFEQLIGIARSDEASEWSIDDFDDSIGWREGDGLQLRTSNGEGYEKKVRFYRPENSGFGRFGAQSNGTVIGISFPGIYSGLSKNNEVVFGKRRRRQIKNLLNMFSDWTGGCVHFVDVNDPRYAHRVSQSAIKWINLWRHSVALAVGSMSGSGRLSVGCYVLFPHDWARTDNVHMHELLHCMGKPHTENRPDYLTDCEGFNGTKPDMFTPFPYHSVMRARGGGECDLEGAEDLSLKGSQPEIGPASVIDILSVFPEIEGLGHCEMHTFKAFLESDTCGSRGPLPYNYPILPSRRCDGIIDCPYEDVYASPQDVDEGQHCIDQCEDNF